MGILLQALFVSFLASSYKIVSSSFAQKRNALETVLARNLPGGPVGTLPSRVGVQVRSLVRELRSHIPVARKPKHKKQKQYCSKFNKDLKKKILDGLQTCSERDGKCDLETPYSGITPQVTLDTCP